MSSAFTVVFALFAVGMVAVATLIVRSAVRRDRARNRDRRAGTGQPAEAPRAGGPKPLSP